MLLTTSVIYSDNETQQKHLSPTYWITPNVLRLVENRQFSGVITYLHQHMHITKQNYMLNTNMNPPSCFGAILMQTYVESNILHQQINLTCTTLNCIKYQLQTPQCGYYYQYNVEMSLVKIRWYATVCNAVTCRPIPKKKKPWRRSFSIQKNQVPVACIYISCVER